MKMGKVINTSASEVKTRKKPSMLSRMLDMKKGDEVRFDISKARTIRVYAANLRRLCGVDLTTHSYTEENVVLVRRWR